VPPFDELEEVFVKYSRQDGPDAVLRFRLTGPTARITVQQGGTALEGQLPYPRLVPILDLIKTAKVPACPPSVAKDLDPSWELGFEGGGRSASYRWRLEAPQGWEPLAQAADQLLRLGMHACGEYL